MVHAVAVQARTAALITNRKDKDRKEKDDLTVTLCWYDGTVGELKPVKVTMHSNATVLDLKVRSMKEKPKTQRQASGIHNIRLSLVKTGVTLSDEVQLVSTRGNDKVPLIGNDEEVFVHDELRLGSLWRCTPAGVPPLPESFDPTLWAHLKTQVGCDEGDQFRVFLELKQNLRPVPIWRHMWSDVAAAALRDESSAPFPSLEDLGGSPVKLSLSALEFDAGRTDQPLQKLAAELLIRPSKHLPVFGFRVRDIRNFRNFRALLTSGRHEAADIRLAMGGTVYRAYISSVQTCTIDSFQRASSTFGDWLKWTYRMEHKILATSLAQNATDNPVSDTLDEGAPGAPDNTMHNSEGSAPQIAGGNETSTFDVEDGTAYHGDQVSVV